MTQSDPTLISPHYKQTHIVWTTAIHCSTACRTLCCGSCSLCRTPPHDWSLARDHITPVLRELHWLPIKQRVKFKVACLVRPSLSRQAPVNLTDDCCLVSDSTQYSLWSADVQACVVPRTHSSYGDRTFAAAERRLWNSLPVQLHNPDITYGLFRRHLKGHLSVNHGQALCDFWYVAP